MNTTRRSVACHLRYDTIRPGDMMDVNGLHTVKAVIHGNRQTEIQLTSGYKFIALPGARYPARRVLNPDEKLAAQLEEGDRVYLSPALRNHTQGPEPVVQIHYVGDGDPGFIQIVAFDVHNPYLTMHFAVREDDVFTLATHAAVR